MCVSVLFCTLEPATVSSRDIVNNVEYSPTYEIVCCYSRRCVDGTQPYSTLLYSTLLFFFVLLSVRNFEEDLGLAREPSAVLLVIDDLRHFRPFLGKVKVVQLDVAATDVVIQPDIIIPHLDVQDHVVHRRDLLEGEGLAVLWVEIIRLLARLLRLQGLVVDPAILLEIEDDVRIGLAQKVGVAEVGDFVEEYGQHSHLALCLFVVF
mmetsp:Transcript_13140/g.36297  ORF Transcript_13140/g.36297 Transcript_13140/m.36297 type:complete len:207 (+) Transcript_13140:480-1100(+)